LLQALLLYRNYFTGSATESNNLALKGIALLTKQRKTHNNFFYWTSLHYGVRRLVKDQGFEVTRLKVDKYGLVDIEDLKKKIRKDTILVSVIHASNEIGTIQPIKEIGNICKEKEIYFHTDAVQSLGKVPIDVNKLKVDLLSASSHKMYGPKGVALLYIRKGVKIEPLLHGGGQEGGVKVFY